MNQYRQHYQPAPAQRASLARDLLQALVIAALWFGPLFYYFWSMTP